MIHVILQVEALLEDEVAAQQSILLTYKLYHWSCVDSRTVVLMMLFFEHLSLPVAVLFA